MDKTNWIWGRRLDGDHGEDDSLKMEIESSGYLDFGNKSPGYLDFSLDGSNKLINK